MFGAKHVSNALFFANRDYALKNIDITTDGNLSRDTVLRVARLAEGQNLFCIDLPKMQERLTSLPQVEDCKLRRILPDKIAIAIQERRPVAWAVPASKTNSFNYEDSYLVDRQGILLKTKTLAPEYLGLPLIMGVETNNLQAGQPLDRDDVKSALELLQVSSEILKGRLQIQSIDLSKGYCLVVTDKQKASITFSPDDLPTQVRRLQTVLTYCDQNNRELQTANFMAQRNIPVTFVQTEQPQTPAEPVPETKVESTPKPDPAAGKTLKAQSKKPKAEHHRNIQQELKKTLVRRALPVSTTRIQWVEKTSL